jgi:hypothetical protein
MLSDLIGQEFKCVNEINGRLIVVGQINLLKHITQAVPRGYRISTTAQLCRLMNNT